MDDIAPSPVSLAESSGPVRRKSYKMAGPQTWALARELYLAGLPAPAVAEKLGVSEHNLRKRATREGWSRRQHAERVLELRLPAVGGDRWPRADTPSPEESAAEKAARGEETDALARTAAMENDPLGASAVMLRRAAAAALRGEAAQAQALITLCEQLKRAYDAFVGAEAGRAGLAEVGSCLRLAERFAWYDALKAECEAKGGPVPSPMQAALLVPGAERPDAGEPPPSGPAPAPRA